MSKFTYFSLTCDSITLFQVQLLQEIQNFISIFSW